MAVAAAALAVGWPAWQAQWEGSRLSARLDQVPLLASCARPVAVPAPSGTASLLASWQSVGGCGASAATGSGPGVRWIGPIVSGGLFNVLCQASYTPLLSDPARVEHQLFVNTLITRDLSNRWQVGIGLPIVYKYLRDPHGLNVDLSNSGLGDVSLQATARLGTIRDTLLTGALGLPTGKHDQRYRMAPLRQHQQLGFGKPTATLSLDHLEDELWGVMVLGGSAAWRGGRNELDNYRAPSASAYAFAGYFLGPVVPSLGLSLTGIAGHDRDQSLDENSGLFLLAPTVAVNWAGEWVGLIAGASFPYQYDGISRTSEGAPRSPWGWGTWTVSLGVALAPF